MSVARYVCINSCAWLQTTSMSDLSDSDGLELVGEWYELCLLIDTVIIHESIILNITIALSCRLQ